MQESYSTVVYIFYIKDWLAVLKVQTANILHIIVFSNKFTFFLGERLLLIFLWYTFALNLIPGEVQNPRTTNTIFIQKLKSMNMHTLHAYPPPYSDLSEIPIYLTLRRYLFLNN